MSETEGSRVVRARISVSGRVQGVGYRAFTVRVAMRRGLVGGVRNLDDGRVELEVEGPKDQILSLIDELKIGPPASRVTAAHTEWLNATGRHQEFRIWY